jgi:cleavage and polyadenylation specificity factor subunit 3
MASSLDTTSPTGVIPFKRQSSIEMPVMDESDILQITALGAGNEVGRSCLVIQYKGKTVMVRYNIQFIY